MNTKTDDIQLIPVEWDSRGNPRRYEVVRPEPQQIEPATIVDTAPIVSPLPKYTQRTQANIEGSYSDRAKGFAIATWQLSVITGLGLVMAALVLGNGLGFVAVSAWFFSGFCAVWLLSFLLHTFVSAEGSQFLETVYLWRFLAREQAERHRRYRTPTDHLERVFGLLLWFLAIAGLVGWLVKP